ncbi:hypothetical protein BDV95DRAFT_613669 [Massariosphaeria phaeospora]|uniref:Uncharacterized protein n=1 Tax=Massariosphaeria phaeospora TaxID=100035 RepID=A0A7C8MJU4_9PLEO|nr:hypothetical protein BDV95DRAFT_613669 [Massariosphaeria phaeospora]
MKLFKIGITALVFLGPACSTPVNELPPLVNRPATDEVWENALCKGNNYLMAMKSSDKAAAELLFPGLKTAASPFQNIKKDVEDWGWLSGDKTDGDIPGLGIPEYIKAAQLLVDEIDYVTYDHDEDEYTMNGRKYKGTGAYAHIAVEWSGVIFALWRLHPFEAAEVGWGRQPAIDELPLLRRSSDLLWAAYALYSDDTDLRQCVASRITNQETRDIIYRALGNKGATKWPGASFDIESNEGLALLGSPNAAAFAYLLIQRKRELGNRCVTKVTAFLSGETANPMLLFDIAECEVLFNVL